MASSFLGFIVIYLNLYIQSRPIFPLIYFISVADLVSGKGYPNLRRRYHVTYEHAPTRLGSTQNDGNADYYSLVPKSLLVIDIISESLET